MKNELLAEKYIGIPYLANGRDTKGIDCWGLVRLIYKQEYNIDLPSLAEDYHMDDNARIEELVNFYKEGWEPTENISAGDVVVFKVLGADTHVGVAISSTHFIHARSEHDSAIESFSSGRWKTRIVGSYKYKENKNVVLNGIPHPLRTERITTAIPPGINLIQMQDWIINQYNIEPEYKSTMHIFVNGHLIPKDMHEFTILKDNDTVEYRVIPGKNALRTILTVAVVVAVAVYAPQLGAYLAGTGATATAVAGYTAAAGLVMNAVGMALVDAIAPVRPPADPTNPGSSERQLMVNGGANRPTPYGSIPFVLGKVRMTPPLGANTYNLFSADGKESYLRMLLVWGYGPLYVDESTLKIGELPISNYEGVTQETLTRITEPTSAELAIFNELYGTDKTQINSGVELTCDGVAGSTPTPGPWLDAVSTDGAVGNFTLAVHFPQGCRKISSKGDTAGKSYASPVQLQIEYKKLSSPTWTAGGTFTVGATAVKDAFTWTKTISFSSTENVQVRIRRLTGTGVGQPTDENYQWVFTSTLVNTTFSRNAKPANDPLNCKIAKTAFEIKASDQLNGQIEGINAIVQTYAKTWNGTAWVYAVTNNPAALFRHVLEHPANPRRVTDAANKINLGQLQYWYDYCVTKGFTYNAIVASQRSVLDVLRDIAAAGRASPAMVDGKWTVVIDEPKANVVQHFTPHNSWGFEGTKSLPKIPDGLRVSFVDEDKNYQESEEIVYATAQSASTAALLENISVPGVTKRSLAIDHARWHMAQAKLRPETYTLNTDIEYIVCNRGDRVKVMHDVPMWGLGSGRIKDIRTNLITKSTTLSTWSKAGGIDTIVDNSATAPDGTQTAFIVNANGTTNSFIGVPASVSSGTTYTKSVYAKAGTTNILVIETYDNNGSGGTGYYTTTFNLTTGTVSSNSSGNTANIVLINNGWYRCTVTRAYTLNTSAGTFYIGAYGSGVGSLYLWAPQLETGSVATDYIPTTTTTNSLYYLDESLPMKANVSYTIRVRNKTGGTTVRTLVPKTSDNYYDTVMLTASATTAEIDISDLFMFGELNQESQDCVVLSIEPTGNKSARLTLVDYGVTPLANIYTDYLNYTNTLTFESQITLPPTLLIQSFGTKVPTITKFVSDETVMERIAPGVFAYKMKVSYTNAINLPATTKSVEFQYDYAAATDYLGTRSAQTAYNSGSITILNVDEGDVLKVRARYVGEDGRTGVWTAWQNHTIVGKTTAPSAVTGFSITADNLTGKLKLAWATNKEVDLKSYEVRTDTNWGNETNLVFLGDAVTCQDTPGALATVKTYYIKALDYSNKYSTTAASASYTVARPATYTGTVTYSYADTSTTDSTVTFNWTDAPSGVFAINTYEVTLTRPGNVITTQEVTGLSWVTAANWVGNATVTIKSKDILGNLSLNASTATTITKARPAAPATITASNFTVVDSQVYLDWLDVAKVVNGLPVGGYEIRKADSNWGVQNADLVWRGSVSNATLKGIVSGANTWYVNTFDTDNVYALNGTTATYTANKPGIVTGLSSKFDNTSATSAVVIFNWTAPAVTSFAVSKYRVKLTRPDATFTTETIDSTTWTAPADWVGDATFTVTTIDVISNESVTNASLIVGKLAPSTPGVVDKTIKEKSIYLDWPDTVKTTLFVSGYELRTADATWGNGAYLWKGSASAVEIVDIVEGTNTWYLKAYDTSGKYSTTAQTITQVITKPSASTIGTPLFANTSASGNTVTFSWTGVKQTFGIVSYNVSLVKDTGTVSANVSGNTWTIPADWVGNATFKISAIDSFGLIGTEATLVVAKVAPTAPSTFEATPNATGLTLKWSAGTQGSLPIAGYELRATGTTPGGADFIWKGTASSYETKVLNLGSNTWDLWAYDTDNRYSAAAKALSYTVVRPSNSTSLMGVFSTALTNATASFTWIKPSTSAFGIEKYEVSFTTTNPARTINSTRNTTDWIVPADWLGTGTLSVTAVDNLGFSSNAVTYDLNKVVPDQPGAFLSATPSGTTVELDWPDNIKTSLPIVGYELRSADSGWGGGGFIFKGNSSHNIVDITGTSNGSTLTWYLKAYDTDGRYSTNARSYSYVVAAPVNTSSLSYKFDDTNLTAATLTLNWKDTIPTFGLKQYEVTGTLTVLVTTTAGSNLITVTSTNGTKGLKVGDTITSSSTIPAGKLISSIISSTQFTLDNSTGITAGTAVSTSIANYRYVNATTLTLPADWLGDKIFTVKTVDNLNNKSTGVQVTATKAIPNAATNFRAQIIDNNVLLYWTLPALTTLPISHARIKKGSNWNDAEVIGDKSGTFTSITELQGGVYTYWLAIVDTDNNESLPVSLGATVSSPPDYIFNAEYKSTFSGTLSNAIIDSQSGYMVMPVNTTETFAGHFTTNAWNAPSDQVTAGYPVYIQPGLNTGYYEEIFDYGSTLGSSQISVAIARTTVVGSPDVSVTISTSLDGISYPSVYTNTTSAFGSLFRYVKVRITATQLTAGSIVSIQSIVVRLDAKQKTDSGTAVMALGAAQPQGNISHDYIDLWIPGSLPTPKFTLNGTSLENSITSAVGPGGYTQAIWNCIDTDANTVGIEADGGWDTTLVPANLTQGHLFAVFMKTTTNNGSSYWGTSGNGTIGDLSGTSNSNPYFWFGDLPAINTWYLVVGYVHEIGYGTADTGISGVYNLAGTKVISGTEFKALSGSTLMHRSYHYFNATASGTIVQQMARPVIIPCTVAEAPSKISYLLQCATGYGMSVTPNQQFIDVVSITATPQGTVPTTPLIDFNDIPSPRRFNIFNYNSSGTLVNGSVSWAVRGY